VPFALPGAIQLLVPAMTAGAGLGAMVDEAGRTVFYPEVISVPLACYPPAVSEAQLACAPLGMAVRGITREEAAAAGVAADTGAIVTRTAPGSRAEHSGLRVGDVVVACDGARVAGAAELEAMVRGAGTDRQIRLRFLRDRQPVEATVPSRAVAQ
jgi:serine protease Do/serine protease DegQ